MVGLEALSMQGLPVDKLLLTRESEDQLADLAGNAMSTTVVGSCILAALVVAKNLLKAGDDMQTYEMKEGKASQVKDVKAIPMIVDDPVESGDLIESHVVAEDQLIYKPLDLSLTEAYPLPDILVEAEKSSRFCGCEGRRDMTSRELFRCSDCSTTFCKKCGGRPEHNPSPIDIIANPRLPPSAFELKLKSTLPMCISLMNISQGLLDGLRDKTDVKIPEKRWTSWCAAVIRAAQSELRFVEPKRQEIWSAVYKSPMASLELLLHPQHPEWRLYGQADETEPANAEIRQILDAPIARFVCRDSLLNGRWEFALPYTTSVTIKIRGTGELVPSWQARLGLLRDEFKDTQVFSRLQITVPDDAVANFDWNISGVYVLLDKCGTANGALHKKESTVDAKTPDLFMFLDPQRTSSNRDCFVVSISKRRYEYGESRPIICKLDPGWRPSDVAEEQEVTCLLPCKWTEAAVKLQVRRLVSLSEGL